MLPDEGGKKGGLRNDNDSEDDIDEDKGYFSDTIIKCLD
jgi:hypothetical protein